MAREEAANTLENPFFRGSTERKRESLGLAGAELGKEEIEGRGATVIASDVCYSFN